MKTVWLAIATIALVVGFNASSLGQDGDDPATILADLRENTLSAEEIQGVMSLPSIRIVSLESFSGANLQKLEETLRATEDNFAEVRTAVERNETFEAALKEQDVQLSDLVAVTQAEAGGVTIYTDKPSP